MNKIKLLFTILLLPIILFGYICIGIVDMCIDWWAWVTNKRQNLF